MKASTKFKHAKGTGDYWDVFFFSQETHGRRGRLITDHDANAINRVEELSYDLKVHEVMTSDLQLATPEMPISNVLEILRINRISGVPVVVDDNRLTGILSLEDIVRALQQNELTAPVKKYMSTKLTTVMIYDPLVGAMQKFSDSGLGRLPVMDENNRIVGMITKGDITRGVLTALQKDYKEEEVRRYRASHLFDWSCEFVLLQSAPLWFCVTTLKHRILHTAEMPPVISSAPL